eukprot:jgi/Galph1/4236/GphlegSOOS_G2880.1
MEQSAETVTTETRKCPQCGSTEFDVDTARGDTACVSCGCILEENAIVSEVTFFEGPGGYSSVVGQFVDATGFHPISNTIIPGLSKESREVTRNNGRKVIAEIVGALHLNASQEESAFRLFLLAIEHNFIQGRKTCNVCASCLYIICRREKTPHLLIDFSDYLQVDIYSLGRTFLKFARVLNLSLPIIDPSLYIHRFASRLGFEEKTYTVAMSALRLIARMKRDWIHTGRRPSGLCGAALFVAAKMHGFDRSQKEIVNVVRIGEVTLRKRLLEFEETSSALLTAEQIDTLGGDDGTVEDLHDKHLLKESDPPAFKRRKNIESRTEDKSIELEMNEVLNSEEVRKIEKGEDSLDSLYSPVFSNVTSSKLSEEESCFSSLENNLATSVVSSQFPSQSLPEEEVLDEEDEDLEFFDIDEDELNSYLNNEQEEQRKNEIWTQLNQDYLDRQAELAQLELDNPSAHKKNKRKPRRYSGKTCSNGVDSAVEAACQALSEKKVSKKVNYSVLQELFRFETSTLSSYQQESQ